jgi:ArsR family transcriptional regulator, arsenate/arsenite/antimonite-responsive transcriptional repressor
MDDKRIKGSVVKVDTCKSAKCRPVATVGGSRSGDDELAKLAWAVAHPARVRLLRILIAHNACMCGELVDHMELAQSTVSQHLKILKESGLIQGEVDGPKVCYCVNPASLSRLKKMVATL